MPWPEVLQLFSYFLYVFFFFYCICFFFVCFVLRFLCGVFSFFSNVFSSQWCLNVFNMNLHGFHMIDIFQTVFLWSYGFDGFVLVGFWLLDGLKGFF